MSGKMPKNLFVVRHGASELNHIIESGLKNKDSELFTDDNKNTPDRCWRLTDTGRKQATTIGEWIQSVETCFEGYYVSPYIRCLETAAYMNLPNARWEEKRTLRERSYGEICVATRDEFKKKYPRNWNFRKNDSIYWRPPSGESIADVAENRVHNFLMSLKHDNVDDSVIVVSHGDWISALSLVLENLSDEQFLERYSSKDSEIKNGACVQYSRVNPFSDGETVTDRFEWKRMVVPVLSDNGQNVEVSEWKHFEKPLFSNEQLLNFAENYEIKFD